MQCWHLIDSEKAPNSQSSKSRSSETRALVCCELWIVDCARLLKRTSDDNEPYEIPLPDDDKDSMETLCKVLHLQHSGLDLTPNIERIKAFSEAADKYDCIDATKFFITAWICQFVSPNLHETGGLLTITYLYNDALAFQTMSKRLIAGWTAGFDRLPDAFDPHDKLPREVFSKSVLSFTGQT